MKKILYSFASILLLILVCLTGGVWLYGDQILNRIVRPQIEEKASQLLSAQVRIQRLQLSGSRFVLADLTIAAPGIYSVTVPEISLDFSLASLRQRRLDALTVTEPRIEIIPQQSQSASKDPAAPFPLPPRLPLTIEHLEAINGEFLLTAAERHIQLRQLDFSGSLKPESSFQLSAFFGHDNQHPLAVDGAVTFMPTRKLRLENLTWQNQQILNSPFEIELSRTDLTFGSGSIRLKKLDHDIVNNLLSSLKFETQLPDQLHFSLMEPDLDISLRDQELQIRLVIEAGQLQWERYKGDLSDIRLQLNRLPQGWSIAGQLQAPAEASIDFSALLDAENSLSGHARLNIPAPDRFKTALFGGSAPVTSGRLKLDSQYFLKDRHWGITTSINGQPGNQDPAEYLLNLSQIGGHIKLAGSPLETKLEMGLQVSSQPFLSASGSLDHIDFSLQLNDMIMLRQLISEDRIPRQLITFEQVEADGTLLYKNNEWSGDLSLSAEQISVQQLMLDNLRVDTKPTLSNSEIILNTTTAAADLSYEDRTTARIQLQGHGSYTEQRLKLSIKNLALSGLNHLSADEQSGISEAEIKMSGTVDGHWPNGKLALDLTGTTGVKEILSGSFYADLSAYRANFKLSGNLEPEKTSLSATNFRFELPQIGVLNLDGIFNPERIDAQLQLEFNDLSESYGDHIGPLFSETWTALHGLTLEGRMALSASLFWAPRSWHSQGILQAHGVDAYWQRRQLEIVDGSGSVPFSLTSDYGDVSSIAQQKQTGTISFHSLAAGPASLEQGQLHLAASPNSFSVISPLRLQMADGEVSVNNLNFNRIQGQPQGSVEVDISRVDLETLTTDLALPVMRGTLSADLGRLSYIDRQLKTSGLATIHVFGGDIELRNMSYKEPFSRHPIFHSDIELSGIDLRQATSTFDFGEMNGLLDGRIEGLELFGTTPSAFSAQISTRLKGKRNISVKALNNLSILSQGGISSALSRGIYQFIDFYRYRRIGFKCSLENDTFTLVGTAKRGSNRYLVHGGLLPPRIDIITSTPTISFKEMLRRLSRIDRAGT